MKISQAPAAFVLLAGIVTACGTSPRTTHEVDAATDADDSGETTDARVDVGPDDDVEDVPSDDPSIDSDDVPLLDAGCTGSPPMCSFGCGGDAFLEGECVGGRWLCSSGTTPMDDCPPGSCFGMPFPGEVCTSNGWQCRPWETETGLPACGESAPICADCSGFDGLSAGTACACTCEGGLVQCGEPVACVANEASTDFGITLRIDLDDCVFTVAELARGVALRYVVEIATGDLPVFSAALDAGRCAPVHESGLRMDARVHGDEHLWCRCDEGLCPGPDPTPSPLPQGTWPGEIEWDGRNWTGPSDTGNPPGDPFPPGVYTFSVRASGSSGDDPDADSLWDITAAVRIYVVDE